MIRQGKYTKKVTLATRAKRGVKRRWQWFKNLSRKQKFALIGLPLIAFLVVIPVATYAYYANDISDQERLMNRNNTGIVLMDKNDEIFYSIGRAEKRDIIPLDQISDTTKEALLAAEDKDFYNHGGFSFISIGKALYANVMSRDATGYGGSTLTQQLAKNTLLTANQTFLRKYQELAISIAIEQQYTKDEILNMYLNSVYFGENAFGIEDAAKTYFNKAPKDLTLAESSMLIGVLPAPSAYSPISGSVEYAKERQTTVLTRMVNNKYISEAEKQEALATVLEYSTAPNEENNTAPHFAEMVLLELNKKYGEERVARSGYQVRTTLDITMQKQLQESVDSNIRYIERNGGSNASAVAIDPKTGELRALIGSADYTNEEWGKVNMVTTDRQPGSSFKPIYYAEALAQGVITPATILQDVPTDFNGYKPLNASRTFSGNVSVRSAISRSLNIPSVKIMEQLGVDESVIAAKRMGIDIDDKTDYGLSLALGSVEASLLEMTNAYAAFANQGQQFSPVLIKQINNKFDKAIFIANQSKPKEVQTVQGSYLISSILSDANARAPIFGSSLTVPGRTAAVKTGTTDNSRDAWTIGYTPQRVVGVWVGNNNNEIMQNGGSTMAGPIWVRAMQKLSANLPNEQFPVPAGVVQRAVCSSNGGLANTAGTGTYNEYFLGSALPKETCSVKDKAQEEAEKKQKEDEEKKKQEEAEKAAEEAEETAREAAEQAEEDANPTDPGAGDSETPSPPPVVSPQLNPQGRQATTPSGE
jgi:1A family penicillin-binding protein